MSEFIDRNGHTRHTADLHACRNVKQSVNLLTVQKMKRKEENGVSIIERMIVSRKNNQTKGGARHREAPGKADNVNETTSGA
jgi:hypothetical protein